MKLKFQEKRIIWLFFITLILNTISNLLSYSAQDYTLIGVMLFVLTLILDIILIVLSIKEIRKGNRALGVLVLVLTILDILAGVSGFLVGIFASYTPV